MAKKKQGSKKQAKSAKLHSNSSGFFTRLEENKYWPVVLFLLLSLIYFAPVLFGNNSLISTEGVLYGHGKTGGSIDDFRNPYSENFLWNTILGGMPAAEALKEYTMYTIVNILKIFLYDFRAYVIYVMLIMFFAGFNMYLFLRRLELSRLLASALGVGYQFAPYSITLMYAGHFSKMAVFALLPLLFTFLHLGMRTGKIKYFLWLGCFIAVDIYTPHLQMVHFSLLALGFYFVFLLITRFLDDKNIGGASVRSAFFVLAVVIGLGIGARGFMPQYVYNKTESKRSGQQGEGLSKSYATSWNSHAEELASLVVPEFVNYSSLKTDDFSKVFYWGKNPSKTNADYFGGIIILLAFLAPFLLRRDRNAWFFFALMIYGILFALGESSPVYNIMYYLVPGIKSFRAPSLMLFISAFSGFVLTGIILNRFAEDKYSTSVKAALYVFIGAAALCMIGALEPKIFLTPWKAVFYSALNNPIADLNSPEAQQLARQVAIFNNNIPELKKGFFVSFAFFAVFGSGLGLLYMKKIRPAALFVLLIPLLLIDFWRIDRDFLSFKPVTPGVNPIASSREIPAYEYLKKLDGEPFRVMPWHMISADAPSLQVRFRYSGLNHVNGFHDFVIRRYDFMMKTVPSFMMAGGGNQVLLNFVNLVSGKYIVAGGQQPNAVFSDGQLSVIENPNALPYFYIRNQAAIFDDEQTMVMQLLTGQFDYFNAVIIEEQPPPGFSALLETDSLSVNYSIDITKFELMQGDIELNVTLDKPGMLVFSENYHSRWRCVVDDAEQQVHRANYLFQGVYIDAGDHTVKFQFYDPAIDLSRNIMYITFSVFLILIVLVQGNVLGRFSGKKVKNQD